MSAVRIEQKVLEPKTRALLGAVGIALLSVLVFVGVLVTQGLGLRGSIDATATGSISDADQR
jgi:branched-subunit amino acid permease